VREIKKHVIMELDHWDSGHTNSIFNNGRYVLQNFTSDR